MLAAEDGERPHVQGELSGVGNGARTTLVLASSRSTDCSSKARSRAGRESGPVDAEHSTLVPERASWWSTSRSTATSGMRTST